MKPGNRPNFISSSARKIEGRGRKKGCVAVYACVYVYIRGKGWPKKKKIKKGWMRIVNRRVEIPIRKIERRVSREPETWRTLNLAAHRSGEGWPGNWRRGRAVNRGRKEESRVASSRVERNFTEISSFCARRNPLFSPDLISGRS